MAGYQFKMKNYQVTVFGGSQLKPGDAAYLQAYQLGNSLGKSGYSVITGGYMGTMEAVSHGAADAGAHVIGITCAEIEEWRGSKCNPWVKEERKHKTLRERISALIDSSDANIALPGGVGTLAEISLVWNEMLIEAIKQRPLILIGEEWNNVITSFLSQMAIYHPPSVHKLIHCVNDINSAVGKLQEYFNDTKDIS